MLHFAPCGTLFAELGHFATGSQNEEGVISDENS